ncbi:MAG: chemotaxis protein [Thiobacillus sp.]
MSHAAHEPASERAGGGSHLEEVERDLAQMNALLEAAIEKLLVSFMSIHRGVASQEAMLRQSSLEHPEFSACSARMENLRADIARHVNEALSGLQFQDMTSQLIRRMASHLSTLREEIGGAGPCNAQPRVVSQRHMECGDIELF